MQTLGRPFLTLAFLAVLSLLSAPEMVSAEQINLSSVNTSIQFLGSHVVEKKPDPEARKGSFKKLSGTATVTRGKLTAVELTIETASISTGNSKLDGHLKSPDFFSVRQYPKATFKSTKIELTDSGTVKITGDLKLLKETKSISFPATVTSAKGLNLKAEFVIDRSQFGMTYGAGKVENNVAMTIRIDG